MARISCKARNHNFLRLAPSGKADDALQRKIGVQPVKKRGFPLAGNAGQAVWPASGFSGVRILSGRRGSAPSDNSAKYKDKETGTVSITGRIEGTNILLFVDDDGPGVPDEALPKLFDVFYRNDPSRKNPIRAVGWGLRSCGRQWRGWAEPSMRKIYPPVACGWHLRSPYGKKEADRSQLDDAAEICRLLVQTCLPFSFQ